MLRSEIKTKISELEQDLRIAQPYEELYRELLDDYTVQVYALKQIGDDFPLEHAIDLSERYQELEGRMMPNGPGVSDEEFEEYVRLNDLLGVLFKGTREYI